jgi:hypothetical protein
MLSWLDYVDYVVYIDYVDVLDECFDVSAQLRNARVYGERK